MILIACNPQHDEIIHPCSLNPATKFMFVQISDVHIGYGPNNGRFAKAVDAINLLNPSFILNTGDTSHHAEEDLALGELEWQEFFRIAAGLHAPLYNVPGNHDIGYNDRGAGDINIQPYINQFGELQQDFEYGGIQFIIINDNPRVSKNWSVVSQSNLDHIKLMLKNGKPTFVSGHIPLLFYGTGEPVNGPAELTKMLENSPSGLGFLGGHLHRLTTLKRNGVWHIAGPDLKENGHNSFLIYKVNENDIEVCTKSIVSDRSDQVAVIPFIKEQ